MTYLEQEERWLNRQREANPIREEQQIAVDADKLLDAKANGCGGDLMLGWTVLNKRCGKYDYYEWCEKHFRWNTHGSTGARVEYRSAHHRGHTGAIGTVIMGEAPPELLKILHYYYHSRKYTHTPPPFPLPRVIWAIPPQTDSTNLCTENGEQRCV
jgi:hypothetical protein